MLEKLLKMLRLMTYNRKDRIFRVRNDSKINFKFESETQIDSSLKWSWKLWIKNPILILFTIHWSAKKWKKMMFQKKDVFGGVGLIKPIVNLIENF